MGMCPRKEIDKILPAKLDKPIVEEEFVKRALISEEDIECKRLTDIDDLEKESENW